MSNKPFNIEDLVVYNGVVYRIHTNWNGGQKFDLIRVYPKSNQIDERGVTSNNLKHWNGKINS